MAYLFIKFHWVALFIPTRWSPPQTTHSIYIPIWVFCQFLFFLLAIHLSWVFWNIFKTGALKTSILQKHFLFLGYTTWVFFWEIFVFTKFHRVRHTVLRKSTVELLFILFWKGSRITLFREGMRRIPEIFPIVSMLLVMWLCAFRMPHHHPPDT